MMKKGKKYVEASKLVDKQKTYELNEAIKLVKDTSITKFDSTIEIAMNLNIDTKKSDQQIRGALVLPNGIGKVKKVLVLAKGPAAVEAKKAGADYVGEQELIDKIVKENWFEFDIIVSTPEMMPSLGKIGKILGPKGLMPNPKSGTVTETPSKVVEDIKKGMIEYRADSFGNVHSVIGKVSFDNEKLAENITYLVNNIIKSKPVSVKGKFIKNITIASTMGPGIKLNLNSFDI
ncbi:MAG: 50S ribosomal protein L1 [Bacilli bacterium]|nr:50S ribosomal protein L1 [Bacilli bacterium]MDD3896157.1 50S ribosomal protein L1 [Bacilli bacterium]MDD4408135.1 50S ribosomal protein L1 [Bacilli bacterium]